MESCDVFSLDLEAAGLDILGACDGFALDDFIVPSELDMLFTGVDVDALSEDLSSSPLSPSSSISADVSGSNSVPGSPPSSHGASPVPSEWDGECIMPKEGEARVCGNCATTSTPLWRKTADGTILCNACGLYHKAYKVHRPQTTRKARPVKSESSQERTAPASSGQSCANCATTVTTLWRRDARGRLCCNACGLYSKMHHKDRPLKLKGQIRPRSRKVGGDVVNKSMAPSAAPKSPSQPLMSLMASSMPALFGLPMETSVSDMQAASAQLAAAAAAAAALSVPIPQLAMPLGYPLVGAPFVVPSTPEERIAAQLRMRLLESQLIALSSVIAAGMVPSK
eukprot:Opistho-1_new@56712